MGRLLGERHHLLYRLKTFFKFYSVGGAAKVISLHVTTKNSVLMILNIGFFFLYPIILFYYL